MNSPLVSICIPTFNSEIFLEETLNGIILQTYKNIEIIIGDNGSTDNTLSIIQKYVNKDNRITYYSNEQNIGYSRNCNKLISYSKGEFVSIYHSDDIYDPTIVEKEVNTLICNSDLLGVFTSYYIINKDGNQINKVQYPINKKEEIIKINLDEYLKIVLARSASCFCCPTSMIRKEVYNSLGGYNENLKYIEDQDMWARILLNGSLGIINDKLIKYRIHENQGSKIYLKREIDSYSIPLKHIFSFLKQNSLQNKYHLEINRAEASELIIFSRLAVKQNNYKLFLQKINESKSKYCYSLKTKSGIIQQFPFPRIIYLLTQLFY